MFAREQDETVRAYCVLRCFFGPVAQFVRAERGVPMGQDRLVAPGKRPGPGHVRAGEQHGVQDENLERHPVRGHTQVQAGRTGHAVQKPLGRRRPWYGVDERPATVPHFGTADAGQLLRVAERQGHGDRSSGPVVDAGRRLGGRSGVGGRPVVRPETVRRRPEHHQSGAVRGAAAGDVHRAERDQRHFAGPEIANGRHGRHRARRSRIHRLQFTTGYLPQVPVQDPGHGARLQRSPVDRVPDRQHVVLHHRGAGRSVRDPVERVRRAGHPGREPLRQQPGTENGQDNGHDHGHGRQPVSGHDQESDGLEHGQAQFQRRRAIRPGGQTRLDIESGVRLVRIFVDRFFAVQSLSGRIRFEIDEHQHIQKIQRDDCVRVTKRQLCKWIRDYAFEFGR